MITNNQPKRARTRCASFFSLATTRSAVTQFLCSDDHYDGDDFEEADAVQPDSDSVLDVYREAAANSHPGSQSLNALGQLTA